jgi:hypothetical protein
VKKVDKPGPENKQQTKRHVFKRRKYACQVNGDASDQGVLIESKEASRVNFQRGWF